MLFSSDSDHEVPLHDPVERPESRDNATEHRVPSIQMRLRRVRDEPLTSSRIGSGQRHPEHPALVPARVQLVAYGVPRSARSVTAGIAILDDEVRHYPVKARPAERAAPGEIQEVPHRERRLGPPTSSSTIVRSTAVSGRGTLPRTA